MEDPRGEPFGALSLELAERLAARRIGFTASCSRRSLASEVDAAFAEQSDALGRLITTGDRHAEQQDSAEGRTPYRTGL